MILTLLSAVSAILAILGIVLLIRLTPQDVADGILHTVKPRDSLQSMGNKLRHHKESGKLYRYLLQMQAALNVTGRGKLFPVILSLSLLLLIAGILISFLLDNLFLVPVAAIAMAAVPFVYVSSSMAQYKKHTRQEMETVLSIITTSYIRSDDIITAVEENLDYIKPPMQEIFRSFLGDAMSVSSNLRQALTNLSLKIDDEIFAEWCETLIQCQDDRTLKDTLQPIVAKLTDIRLVNSELATMLASVRGEYLTMVALVVCNIPLLYFLNKDWYRTLMFTTPGKVVLAICAAVIFITAIFMYRFTRPVEYKR